MMKLYRDFNTSNVTIQLILPRFCRFKNIISIHLMLLFNYFNDYVVEGKAKFQYI